MVRIVSPYVGMLGSFISNLAFKRKLKRYWGTTTIEGVEVFNKKKYIYPSMSASTVKFLKLINAYDKVKNSKYQGVSSAWLFLNPDKQSGATKTYFTKELIASLLEDYMEINKPYKFNVVFSNREYYKEFKNKSIQSWNYTSTDGLIDLDNSSGNTSFSGMNKEQLKDYIVANWDSIRQNNVTQGGCEVDELDEFAGLLFYNDSQDEVEVTIGKIEVVPIFKMGYAGNGMVKTPYKYAEASFNVEFTAKRIANLGDTSDVVNRIYTTATLAEAQRIGIETGTYETSTDFSSQITIGSHGYAATDIWYYPATTVYGFMGSGATPYLKVSAFDSVKSADAIKMFMMSIDQDYRKKKTKWWKKILVLVITAVVVWFFPPAGGWAGLTGTALLEAVAFSSLVAGLTLAAIGYVAAQNGMYGIAEFAAKVGQISGIIGLVAGIGAAIQTIGKQIATGQAAKELAQKAVVAGTASPAQQAIANWSYGKIAFEAIKKSVFGGGAWEAFTKAFSFASGRIQAYQQNKIADIDSRSQELKQKSSELEQKAMLENDDLYIASLEPLYANSTIFRPLDMIEDSYYYEGLHYNPTKYNIQKAGPFEPVGVFKPANRLI